MTREHIENRLHANGISCPADLPDRIGTYMDLLADWNTRMDLTAVLAEEETLDRHFLDSLTVLRTPLLAGAGQLIDVGTGAGFPGLVLAMALPNLRVTLLDAQQKRLQFLEAVCGATGTKNVTLVHARAEDGGRQPDLRERFDLAVARAVAPLNVLCEYLLPFVRQGGLMLCWKGPALTEELEAGRRAAHLLGGRLEMPAAAPVAGRDWEHRILPIRKIQPCAARYPRRAGMPKSKPLGV